MPPRYFVLGQANSWLDLFEPLRESALGRKRTRRRKRVPSRVMASTLDPKKPLTKSYKQLPKT